jgi:hypothetical protein
MSDRNPKVVGYVDLFTKEFRIILSADVDDENCITPVDKGVMKNRHAYVAIPLDARVLQDICDLIRKKNIHDEQRERAKA